MRIREELAAIHAQMRARALLIAIEWAGSASTLAEAIGYSRFAGIKWQQRGHIPVVAAHRLAAIPGFPLFVDELCPAIRLERSRCPRCGHVKRLAGDRTGCPPSFNGRSKATVQALARIAARHAAQP